MEINSDVLNSSVFFLIENGFIWVPCPITVPASGACESVSTLFHVKPPEKHWWRKKQAFLAQTSQLHLERALLHHEKVFTVGASSRAEGRIDGRHLTEFTLLEIEMCGNFETLKDIIKNLFKYISFNNPQCHQGMLFDKSFKNRLKVLGEINELTYSNSLETYLVDKIITNGTGIEYGDDLHSNAEQILTSINNQPVLVTKFPNNQHPMNAGIEIEKFFNMKPNPEDGGKTVLSCDLILPKAGECLGGAERIYDSDLLEERLVKSKMYETMKALGIDKSGFDTYLNDMKNFGKDIGPHCGFGLGVPRLVQFLCNLDTIEEAVCFPSTREKLL